MLISGTSNIIFLLYKQCNVFFSYAAGSKPDTTVANQKYTPLQTHDPDEFFSKENIEMAMMHNRGGFGY